MPDEPSNVESNVFKHLEAIDLCLSKHLRMPALVLIYSGIDILASLARPEDKPNVVREDFLEWCERYLIPAGFNECAPIDLYAARCAVVHTYSSESALSRSGDAREIVYAWGNRPSQRLQDAIDVAGINTLVVIHIDGLARAFRAAVLRFFEAARGNAVLNKLLAGRSQKFFKDYGDVFDP